MGGYRPGAGRRPTPSALKLVRGTRGRRPEAGAWALSPRLPRPPEDLSEQARREWYRIGGRLRRLGLMTELDTVALEVLVRAYARLRELHAHLARHGMFIADQDGALRPSPLLAAARDAERDVLRAAVEFGLSPSARERVRPPARPGSGDLDGYFA